MMIYLATSGVWSFATKSRRKYCGVFAQSKNCGGSETAVAR
jgi:hypothetical protein